MIEHPDSENSFCSPTGKMNPEEQDSRPLPKEKIPIIKNKKLIRRTMKKRKSRTKVHTLSESSELDLKKAKDSKNYEPLHWPNKKYSWHVFEY